MKLNISKTNYIISSFLSPSLVTHGNITQYVMSFPRKSQSPKGIFMTFMTQIKIKLLYFCIWWVIHSQHSNYHLNQHYIPLLQHSTLDTKANGLIAEFQSHLCKKGKIVHINIKARDVLNTTQRLLALIWLTVSGTSSQLLGRTCVAIHWGLPLVSS